MREIRQMLRRLCPDGVEYRKLGDVCEINKGIQFNKRDMNATGTYPVINGGIAPSGYIEQYNRCEETITVSQGGASAGFVNWLDRKFWAGAHCYTIVPSERVDNRFLFHFVKSREGKFKESQYGAGIPALPKLTLENLPVPVPPMAVQREIAATLDKFTTLEAELEAELECRKKQYEFYRNALLSFDGSRAAGVEWARLGDVCEMRGGYTPSKKVPEYWENGNIPWFRMEDIRENGRILSDSIQHITPEAVKGRGLFPANSIIMATTATIGEHALLIVDSLANQRFTNLAIRESFSSRIEPMFFFYYMFVLGEWCKNNINASSFASVDMNKFRNVLVPVPPIAEQRRIVEILDRFDALTTSLSEGLPAEIKARREQYEFYRDRLLTFERKLP